MELDGVDAEEVRRHGQRIGAGNGRQLMLRMPPASALSSLYLLLAELARPDEVDGDDRDQTCRCNQPGGREVHEWSLRGKVVVDDTTSVGQEMALSRRACSATRSGFRTCGTGFQSCPNSDRIGILSHKCLKPHLHDLFRLHLKNTLDLDRDIGR